ncbi:MAG: translation initiation inhibitor [Planctomycetota bacterium]|nr:translation initiation inhibitor [Planctomycetota bacterium]
MINAMPQDGLYARSVGRGNVRVHHLTILPVAGDNAAGLGARAARAVLDRQASVAWMLVFAPAREREALLGALAAALGSVAFPVTWVIGPNCTGGGVAGIELTAVSGTTVRTLSSPGGAGAVFEDEYATYCWLGGVGPDRIDDTPEQQARQTYANTQGLLLQAGMGLADLARTWLYNDAITAWYAQFNAVRTEHYRAAGVLERLIPASTGIGAPNPSGSALTLAGLALRPRQPGVSVQVVPSPLQGPATEYGSFFSRAVEIASPASRTLLISGTAGIDPAGETVSLGDVAGQIDCTLEVVKALLASRGMGWGDVTRAVGYFKHAADAGAFNACARRAGLGPLPLLITHCDICRDNLLFELELDAVAG